jgi:hypothetical protein
MKYRRRKKKTPSSNPSRARELLGGKIAINMKDLEEGNWGFPPDFSEDDKREYGKLLQKVASEYLGYEAPFPPFMPKDK